MKRSEMLRDIAAIIFWNRRSIASNSDLAKAILDGIEKRGMKPPEYLKPIEYFEEKQYPLVPGDIQRSDGQWATPAAEWEPEDET